MIPTCRGRVAAVCFASCLLLLPLTAATAPEERSLFGTVEYKNKGLPHVLVGERGKQGIETSDSGQFLLDLGDNITLGAPIVLRVTDKENKTKEWVIVDPINDGTNGKLYFPDQRIRGQENIPVYVVARGDPELLKKVVIMSVLEGEASFLDLKAVPAKGDDLASIGSEGPAIAGLFNSPVQQYGYEVSFANFRAPAEAPPAAPATQLASPRSAAPEAGSQTTQVVAVSAPAGFLKAKADELGFSEEQLRSAIAEFSKEAVSPYERGLAALHDRRYADASRDIRESLGSAFDGVAGLISLATAEVEQQKYAAAEAALMAAGGLKTANTTVLNNLGVVLTVEAKYWRAEKALQQALAINESALGGDAPETARNIANLALLYRLQAKYEKAELFSRRALTIAEKTYGPKHHAVAEALQALAEAYTFEGRYPEAQEVAQRALDIDEELFGPAHAYVASDLTTLAAIRFGQAKYAEAEDLQKRALAIRAKEEPQPDDLDVARDLYRLALIYSSQGRDAEAKPLLVKVLRTYERVLGPYHPSVAEVLDGLAFVYSRSGATLFGLEFDVGLTGRPQRYLKRAVEITGRTLGPYHPDFATRLTDLGVLLIAESGCAGAWEAQSHLERAVNIYEAALGPRHPRLGYALYVLGVVHECRHRYAEAERHYKRAIEIAAEQPQRPRLARYLNALATLYYVEEMYKEAEGVFLRALSVRVAALGPYDSGVADLAESLAKTLKKLGRMEEAEQYKKQATEIRTHHH